MQLQEKRRENRRKGDRKEREEKEEDLERDHVFPALHIYINETSIIYRIVSVIYKIAEQSLNLINTFNIKKSLYKSQCFQTSQTKEFDWPFLGLDNFGWIELGLMKLGLGRGPVLDLLQ